MTNGSRTGSSTWLHTVVFDLARHFRWSFIPPLMVYLAAGVSGLTAIVGAFFVKDYLGLSAAFLAGLAFWTGIPWTLKMPLGHLVDLLWRRKALLVYLGAGLIALSLVIMYLLIAHTDVMARIAPVEAWFVLSSILSPIGYVIQDVVADAMTVEAVPLVGTDGRPFSQRQLKAMHTTMQTLGRIAIISGLVVVASLNIFMFSDAGQLSATEIARVYARIYLIALVIPVLSVTGVILGEFSARRRARELLELSGDPSNAAAVPPSVEVAAKPNIWLLGGGLGYAAFTITVGLSDLALAQEIVFVGSMLIVAFLMSWLIRELPADQGRMLVGTAIIIFAFRAMPLPGPGQTWFEIDELGFDQQFLSILNLITSCLALAGMVLLRPLIASRSIAEIVVWLTVASAVLALPNIGLYYGLHRWTGELTGGIVDAHFIAILDTAVESPLGQVAMIPMLAWIAQNAPAKLKATFFAVMASFTNLALSASSLATRYLNEVFVVTREVRDRSTGALITAADYDQLGLLLIAVALIALALPILTVVGVQNSRLRTSQ